MMAKGSHATAAVTPSVGVTVYAVVNGTGEVAGSDVTEDDGSYFIEGLPAGTYDIVVDKEGYSPTSTLSVTVDASNNYSVTDGSVIVTPDGVTSVDDGSTRLLPAKYQLEQNYPNPFNPTTEIRFDLPQTSNVSLKIYNLIGQEVAILTNTVFNAGSYQIQWNGVDDHGSAVGSGIYFVKLVASSTDGTSEAFSQVRKMILLK